MKKAKGGAQLRVLAKRCIDRLVTVLHPIEGTEQAIVVSGSPRSGTTWLMQTLSCLPGYRSVLEPLHPSRFPTVRDLRLPPRLYVVPGHSNRPLEEHLRAVLTGKRVSRIPEYTLSLPTIRRRLMSSRILAKFVNGNRLLPWISERLHPRSVILILRHPCSTIASQTEIGFFGYTNEIEIDIVMGRTGALRDIVLSGLQAIPEFRGNAALIRKVEKAETREELLAYEWALDNYIPLRHAGRCGWQVVSYEQLLCRPEQTFQRVFDALGEPMPALATRTMRKPSMTSERKRIQADVQLTRWQSQLQREQVRLILDAVGAVGLDLYSDDVQLAEGCLEQYVSTHVRNRGPGGDSRS